MIKQQDQFCWFWYFGGCFRQRQSAQCVSVPMGLSLPKVNRVLICGHKQGPSRKPAQMSTCADSTGLVAACGQSRAESDDQTGMSGIVSFQTHTLVLPAPAANSSSRQRTRTWMHTQLVAPNHQASCAPTQPLPHKMRRHRPALSPVSDQNERVVLMTQATPSKLQMPCSPSHPSATSHHYVATCRQGQEQWTCLEGICYSK